MGKPFRRGSHELSPLIQAPTTLTELYPIFNPGQLDVKVSLSKRFHGANASTKTIEQDHTADAFHSMLVGTDNSVLGYH